MSLIIKTIETFFSDRGHEQYAKEMVSQLQHALHCASLAENDGAPPQQIVAALLHDVGHIMTTDNLPEGLEVNLHDKHEERAYKWLKGVFGDAVAEPVRLHVKAKRYLCTVDADYRATLSPTSLKSFKDQGGDMSAEEIQAFEREPYFQQAIQLRKWDDTAKDPDMPVPALEHFYPYIQQCSLT